MKKNNEIQNKTLDQLQKEYKNLKIGTNFLAGILIVLFVVTVYSSISQKTFDPLLAVALSLGAILPRNYKKMKDLKNEIESRE